MICHGDARIPERYIGEYRTADFKTLVNFEGAQLWSNLFTVDREECKNCEALFTCGGGCPQQAMALFGDFMAIDKASCIFYKGVLKWILRKYYQATVKDSNFSGRDD
jgi:radical SAM protein with 4Fe4S-binding SPASM domain